MKLKRKIPCNECPFRKNSTPGWLGPWTVDSILSQVHGEGGLACHKDVGRFSGMSNEETMKKAHICVGSVMHATKSCKSYRNPILSEFQKIVGKCFEDILDYLQFKKHHRRDD